ncbi:MAG: Fic family protein [Flavobacteriales bacterium]|jgi:predicted transcriptional regulator/prophage maintenance system killer protein|nr:Fic family protein [Flavobacteriales bacterium]
MLDERSTIILEFVAEHAACSSKEIHDGVNSDVAYATTKRLLSKLVAENLLATEGKGKATKYVVNAAYRLFVPIDQESYFEKEIDERDIADGFNFELIGNTLKDVPLFTAEELKRLNALQQTYKDNVSQLSEAEYSKELTRLAVDLSWKSSQIEGNTYSLLETERLLNEKITTEGKSKDEATMLLNHKDALDFIIANPKYISPLTVSNIEDIHSLLVKELGIDRNIRKRRVGISGTNYKPLDNEFQIKEALQQMCELVNARSAVFEKALLLLVLISYIQPFGDGNKRTARIISNAILIENGFCPISFRTVDSIDYKKAMLLFYEQNNISAFKRVFLEQFQFAVNTYF